MPSDDLRTPALPRALAELARRRQEEADAAPPGPAVPADPPRIPNRPPPDPTLESRPPFSSGSTDSENSESEVPGE